MFKMLQYKVFRQKFILAAIAIVLIAVLIVAASYGYFRSVWINDAHNKSLAMNDVIERNLQKEDDLLALQINNAYASPQLIDDLRYLLASASFTDYLAARLDQSRTSSAPIRSFPEYIRSYARQHKSALHMLVFHGEDYTHVIHFGSGRSEIVYEFDVANQPVATQTIEDGFTILKTVYNPSMGYEKVGDISFVFRSSDILSDLDYEGFTMVALQDNGSNPYLLKGNVPNGAPLLEMAAETSTGRLSTGLFNNLYFSRQESYQFSYQLITCVDDRILIEANYAVLLVVIAVMCVIGTISIVMFLYNMRYDFIFVENIFETINAMKQGVFDSIEVKENDRYQRNEYGRIARELGDLSHRLKRYIQAEYQLKIQQQQTEMRALQNQINPHFLYNILEAISAQALMNDDRPTADAITALGSLFRDIVNMPSQITLKDEVGILQTYLRIMEFKSAGKFLYQVVLEPELEKFPTVKFWLQPLAENFFKHGFNPDTPYNLLIVNCYMEQAIVCIDLQDNGISIPEEQLRAINESLNSTQEPDGGIGLRNVYSRLSFFYGSSFTMTMANNKEGGVIIRIRMTGGEQHVQPVDC